MLVIAANMVQIALTVRKRIPIGIDEIRKIHEKYCSDIELPHLNGVSSQLENVRIQTGFKENWKQCFGNFKEEFYL